MTITTDGCNYMILDPNGNVVHVSPTYFDACLILRRMVCLARPTEGTRADGH
jgi:hypothetical protein